MRLFVFGLRASHVFVMVLCLTIDDTIDTIVFIINNICRLIVCPLGWH